MQTKSKYQRKKERRAGKQCMKCGGPLSIADDYRILFQQWNVKCKACREKENKAEKKRKLEEKKRRAEQQILSIKCFRCGRELNGINRAIRLCGKCLKDDEDKIKSRSGICLKSDKRYEACVRCMWAKFHGDNWSCITAMGTGPVTRDCLKYTCLAGMRRNRNTERRFEE